MARIDAKELATQGSFAPSLAQSGLNYPNIIPASLPPTAPPLLNPAGRTDSERQPSEVDGA